METQIIVAPSLVDLRPAIETTCKKVRSGSRRIYVMDIKYFLKWMLEQQLTTASLAYAEMIAYQAYLLDRYAKAGAARRLSVARTLLAVHSRLTGLPNPALGLPVISLDDESPHRALDREEARDLLLAIDRETLIGKRNYAIIKLLVRTGLRRAEVASLTIGDLGREAGHHIAWVQRKGNKRGKIKLPVDVFRAIEEYIQAAGRRNVSPAAPLFVQMRKGNRVTEDGISDKVIERLVIDLGERIGMELTPHDLRTTFITLALQGGADLRRTQYAAGHRDPRTTERYDRRKDDLDNNAVDYIRIDA
jgi:integrase/recombinase XerD